MLDNEMGETQDSLFKIKRICHKINILMWVVFAVLSISWLVSVGSIIAALLEASNGALLLKLILCIAYGAVVATMFVAFSRVFLEVSKGDSPFTLTQVKRLRVIAALLVVYGVLDNAITNCVALMQANGVNAGYISTNSDTIVSIYFAPFIIAAVVFAFSFVFKYGVLLQKFSDETL